MAAQNKLFQRLIWLVDTIYSAGKITRDSSFSITYDFIQELRKQGSNLEVLAPDHLRESFKQEAALLGRLYWD